MTCNVGVRALASVLLAFGAARGAPPAPPPRAEVREQMQQLFEARLKTDVGLDDAAVARIAPQVEDLERERALWRRERGRLLRELRRGVARGMPDTGLQHRLDALDRLSRDSDEATRTALARIDRDLSAPQRVRLRFLLVEFRRDMNGRIRELRRDARRGAPPGGP